MNDAGQPRDRPGPLLLDALPRLLEAEVERGNGAAGFTRALVGLLAPDEVSARSGANEADDLTARAPPSRRSRSALIAKQGGHPFHRWVGRVPDVQPGAG